MRKLLLELLLSLFGIIIAFVLLELAFRLIQRKSVRPQWNDRPVFYFQHENSPTLQDYPYLEQKPENTFRVGIVGDSFTFAPYMQFTDAFPKQLERMLNLNKTPLKAEVINYGVPAYSTSHEVSKVEQAIKEKADLIIMQVTLNDPEVKRHTPIGITNFSRFGPMTLSPLKETLFKYCKPCRFTAERIHNTKTHRAYVKYFFDLYKHPQGWKEFLRAWKQIVATCAANNTKVVAVVFPLFGLELDSNYPFYPIHDKIDKMLTDLGIPHFDISEYYKGIPLERLQVMPGEDRHPNEIGHRMAAERIYLWLEKNSYIPEDLKIRLKFQGRTQIVKEKPYSTNP